jgi:protein gp37
MGKETKIAWTDATVNFWTGCKKVSPGCKFCYMYRDKDRYGLDASLVQRTSKKTFEAALSWKEPKKIFTCSWSDFFIDEADAWREDAWEVIRKTPQHTWQILTKRPDRIKECLPDDWGEGYPNVWLGVSIESPGQLWRIPHLVDVPARIRFLSIEPLIEQIDLFGALTHDGSHKAIQWVIIGGESGNETGKWGYRKCELQWIERVVSDCVFLDIAPFVKQVGTYLAKGNGFTDRAGSEGTHPVLSARFFPREIE